jgi:hypothetical protein
MVFAIMGFWILNWTIGYSVGIQGIFDNGKTWFDYWGFVVVVSEYQSTYYTEHWFYSCKIYLLLINFFFIFNINLYLNNKFNVWFYSRFV